jgi:ceramide glucosyltransferase
MAPGGFAGSVITHTMAIGFFAGLAAGFSLGACGVLLISCLLRWGSAAAIARMLVLPHRRLWLLPLRDVLSFAVFVASFCGRSVSWRDQVFQVDEVGRMTAEGDKPV